MDLLGCDRSTGVTRDLQLDVRALHIRPRQLGKHHLDMARVHTRTGISLGENPVCATIANIGPVHIGQCADKDPKAIGQHALKSRSNSQTLDTQQQPHSVTTNTWRETELRAIMKC